MTAPKVTELTKFDPIVAGLADLKERFTWDDAKLDAMLVHVDEKDVVAGAKKTLTTTRTKLATAKKEAKAPYLEAGKVIEAKFKEIEAAIKEIEAPIDAAIKRRKDKDAADAAAAQQSKDDEIARLKAELAAANGKLAEEGHKVAEFTEKAIQLSVTTDEQYAALRKLFGRKVFSQLQHDEDGNEYELEMVVRRTELSKKE